jgi:hypothetical protein
MSSDEPPFWLLQAEDTCNSAAQPRSNTSRRAHRKLPLQ